MAYHRAYSPWWSDRVIITAEEFTTRDEATDAERRAIATENPIYNIACSSPRPGGVRNWRATMSEQRASALVSPAKTGRRPDAIRRVVDRLTADIEAGIYRQGDWLPAARILAPQLGVGRSTILRAVGVLAARGLVLIHPDQGATIRRAKSKLAEYGLVEIHERRGAKVTMTIPHKTGQQRAVSVRRTGRIYEPGEYATPISAIVAAPPDVAAALGLDPGEPVIRRHRVTHNADGTIESVSTSWYDGRLADVAPRLLSGERIPEGSWAYLEARTGRRAVGGSEVVEARMATEEEAAELQVDLPTAVKVAALTLRDAHGGVVEYGVSVAAAGRRAVYEFDLPA